MNTKKRVVPTNEIIEWRSGFLAKLRKIKPVEVDGISDINLEMGNKKIGTHGKFFNSVFVWNLPSVATCPGASDWCLRHCYNADEREDVFPTEDWAKNWWAVTREPAIVMENINSQLDHCDKPAAVRIHSSGDFFSTKYIEFWINIARKNPNITFWSYTRSWITPEFFDSLEGLKGLDNVHLFASWDETMDSLPPKSWRVSYVTTKDETIENYPLKNRKYLVCPEQKGKIENCASCGFCMREIKRDIYFYFH